jgi:nicotinamidase-related amidase
LAARAAGFHIVHTRSGPEHGFDFIDALRPAPKEAVFERPSEATFDGAGLEALLVGWGVSTLLLSGQAVESGLEFTAWGAARVGHACWRVSDASVGRESPASSPALNTLTQAGAVVARPVSTASVLAAIRACSAAPKR